MRIGCDLLNDIFRAYYDARRHKRNTKSQLAFEMDLEHNLIELYEQIRDRTYRPSPGICFITEHPVKREIFASPFRDRVVHHLLFNYLAPLFECRMIHDSYSCRKGKGTSLGIERFEHHIRSCTRNYTRSAYILKLDLRGYFMSIDKRLLYSIIERTVGRKKGVADFDYELTDFLLRAILFRNPVEIFVGLERSAAVQEPAEIASGRGTADRRSDIAVVQQYLSRYVGRICEANIEMSSLRALCR